MAVQAHTVAASGVATGDFRVLAKSFERSLLAANRAPATIHTYTTGVRLFGNFLTARGMPLVVAHITREHVEEYLVDLMRRSKPNTAETRYRALHVFFNWAVEDGEIRESPMARVKRPAIPETPPSMLTDDDLKRLLKVCEGASFVARRDTAIVRLFIDTGMRRSELAYLKLDDVDLEHNIAYVMGKGRRPRACPFGRKTAQALDRYVRARAQHRCADTEAFWLGLQSPLSS